jgi:hypothetical protein
MAVTQGSRSLLCLVHRSFIAMSGRVLFVMPFDTRSANSANVRVAHANSADRQLN